MPPWLPLTILVVTGVGTVSLLLAGGDAGALPFVLLLATFLVGANRPLREVVPGLVLVYVGLVAIWVGGVEGFDIVDLLVSAVAYALAAVIGWTLQNRRRRIEGFAAEQAEAARQAAADERLRIAQELHDVVAHSLGVIAVQAGVGLHVMDAEPEEARRALQHISQMSRSSITEIRWLLGRVRNTDGSPAYRPAPGLSDLTRLADEVAHAGLDVDLRVDDDVDDVPPGVGLAAYRIVQEALTNALRHAQANRADVRVGLEDGVLEVEVTDDGRGMTSGPHGHGLVGMRERAAVYGGSVEAGPRQAGGFRVSARLPFAASVP